ncbi:hypothetical protein [Streptomyces sp. NPDC055036]
MQFSRHTLRVVRQNYGLAIGVNLVGLLAAPLHNTSSIAVVANSARLVTHMPHLPQPPPGSRMTSAPLETHRVR